MFWPFGGGTHLPYDCFYLRGAALALKKISARMMNELISSSLKNNLLFITESAINVAKPAIAKSTPAFGAKAASRSRTCSAETEFERVDLEGA